MTLLEPILINPDARSGVIVLCEHASNHVPPDYEQLGLTDEELERHIAWDIGAERVTKQICKKMKAAGVLSPVSRLVIDKNREPDHPTLIPPVSDGTVIPANQDLPPAAIEARKKAYYEPFHKACDELIEAHLAEGIVPLIIGMHSFTPEMAGEERPWQIGFLWNKDQRLAQALIGMVERETDLTVGDNLPYSGKDLYYTMQRHGADRGLPQTTIEIRQDLLADNRMVFEWSKLLVELLEECMQRSDIVEIKHY